MINKEKLKDVIKTAMHKTYSSPDEILKHIEENMKIEDPYSWEVRGNTAHLIIKDCAGVTIKLKEMYSVTGVFIQEYNKEKK